MKVLHLTLKKKWFDMIASGGKKEEYRDVTDYWKVRLMYYDIVSRNNDNSFRLYNEFKDWDAVLFKNGYGKNSPTVLLKFNGIGYGRGQEDWGAEPGKEYFVIKLGKIIQSPNTQTESK